MDEEIALLVLRDKFGHTAFRGEQRACIEAVLSSRDCLYVAATGTGKSLTYQLPGQYLAEMFGETYVTVVISPLIALMHDQALALKALGIPAVTINSETGTTAGGPSRAEVFAGVAAGAYAIVFTTPESVPAVLPQLQQLVRDSKLALIAIDEAHTVSEWGQDFRPEFRKLSVLRDALPSIPILALTATATPRVRADVIAVLGLRDPVTLLSTFNRPNLHYAVKSRGAAGLPNDVAAVLRSAAGPAIVYCNTKAETEEIATRINGMRIPLRAAAAAAASDDGGSAASSSSSAASSAAGKVRVAAAYHAGLAPHDRTRVHNAFAGGSIDVVCATIAFGMGIDKRDIRCVIHIGMCKTIEAYYQQTGRAGRDGDPARCVYIHAPSDYNSIAGLVGSSRPYGGGGGSAGAGSGGFASSPGGGYSTSASSMAEDGLRAMNDFTLSNRCRRRMLLEYFGELPSSVGPGRIQRTGASLSSAGPVSPLAATARDLRTSSAAAAAAAAGDAEFTCTGCDNCEKEVKNVAALAAVAAAKAGSSGVTSPGAVSSLASGGAIGPGSPAGGAGVATPPGAKAGGMRVAPDGSCGVFDSISGILLAFDFGQHLAWLCQALVAVGGNTGITLPIGVVRGANNSKLQEKFARHANGPRSVACYGKGAKLPEEYWKHLAELAQKEGLVAATITRLSSGGSYVAYSASPAGSALAAAETAAGASSSTSPAKTAYGVSFSAAGDLRDRRYLLPIPDTLRAHLIGHLARQGVVGSGTAAATGGAGTGGGGSSAYSSGGSSRSASSGAAVGAGDELEGAEAELYDALAAQRTALASAEGVPAYCVCINAVLRRICRERPSTVEALGAVEGMGHSRASKYGAGLLGVLVPEAARLGLATTTTISSKPLVSASSAAGSSSTQLAALQGPTSVAAGPPTALSTAPSAVGAVPVDSVSLTDDPLTLLNRLMPVPAVDPVSAPNAESWHMLMVVGNTVDEAAAAKGVKASTVCAHIATCISAGYLGTMARSSATSGDDSATAAPCWWQSAIATVLSRCGMPAATIAAAARAVDSEVAATTSERLPRHLLAAIDSATASSSLAPSSAMPLVPLAGVAELLAQVKLTPIFDRMPASMRDDSVKNDAFAAIKMVTGVMSYLSRCSFAETAAAAAAAGAPLAVPDFTPPTVRPAGAAAQVQRSGSGGSAGRSLPWSGGGGGGGGSTFAGGVKRSASTAAQGTLFASFAPMSAKKAAY